MLTMNQCSVQQFFAFLKTAIVYACVVVEPSFASDQIVLYTGKRQLFVDGHLIADMNGVRRVLHQPQMRETAIRPEHPWESMGVSSMCVIKDGGIYRAWYRADVDPAKGGFMGRITAYAESTDGVVWTKPNLGLIEFDGNSENNLVWIEPGSTLSVFKDGNPAARPDELYKAIARVHEIERSQLIALVSPDGLRWKLAAKNPVLSEPPFDTHNIAFWDPVTSEYVVYARGVQSEGPLGRGMTSRFYERQQPPGGVRAVRRATSKDFQTWSELKLIDTGAAPREEFYTNSTIRYERAPDYMLMFPSRFASAREPKPGWEHGKGVNDIALLSSRDGVHWDRTFMEAFIRPGLDQGNWHERSLYMERGIIQTSPTELSLYCMQNWRLPSNHIRRYTLRPEGFVSVQAPYEGGELVTKPFVFSGAMLELNYSTSAVGSIQVEIQDATGRPLPGFSLADCPEIYGDHIEHIVKWKHGTNLATLAGRQVRLRFVMHDADLFAFRFR